MVRQYLMDPQPPTAWLGSGLGVKASKTILSKHMRSAMLLIGPGTRVEPEDCVPVQGLQEELGDSAGSVG